MKVWFGVSVNQFKWFNSIKIIWEERKDNEKWEWNENEMRMKWTQSKMKKERKTIKDSGKRLNVMDVQLKPWYSIINVTQ